MGKSNKKTKSDHINGLRKQYDAFLEEDKRRKERNDFILGKLDKMRYTTALVPLRHKPSALDTRPVIIDHQRYQSEFTSIPGFEQHITNPLPLFPVKNSDEAYLIQEICKKYILIPKHTTMHTFTNNYVRNMSVNQNTETMPKMQLDQDIAPIKDLKPSVDDNTDWKSKYEILNILKKEEKESQPSNKLIGFVAAAEPKRLSKENILANNNDQAVVNCDNRVNLDVRTETSKDYVNELPEKELSSNTLHYELPEDNPCSVNSNTDRKTNIESDNNEKLVSNVEKTDLIGEKLQNITLDYQNSNEPIDISREETTYYEQKPECDDNNTTMLAEAYLNQNAPINDANVQDVNPVPDMYPLEDGSHNIQDQNMPLEQHESGDVEKVVFVDSHNISPVHNLNYNSPSITDVNASNFVNENAAYGKTQEFELNNDVQMKTDEIHIADEKTHTNSNVGNIEQPETVIEQTENSVNITESINDFDSEQREMFYSEPTDGNYLTQQSDVQHPTEYPENEYAHNQEYAYYENTDAVAYPAELNNEEVTQQYDPNYEQQYIGSEEQQYVQQYQEPEQGTNQVDPEFEPLQYEQQYENEGQIEATLDVQDGYIAQEPVSEAIEITNNLN